MTQLTHWFEHLICLRIVAALVFLLTATSSAVASGLLIGNVLVVDGSGSVPVPGSVRIAGDVITAVGNLAPQPGDVVFDGRGQVLAPGFIDTHSHADELILDRLDARPKITQGITTVIVGQDGSSPYPLADFFAALETTPAKINVASYVGHNTLRAAVMSENTKRAASPAHMQAMAQLLGTELNSGAIGLSTGLEYEPGIYSEQTEVMLLAQQTAERGGRYISHIRSEDRWFEEALAEIINIGRLTGMPVQISHLKLAMKRLWGTAPNVIRQLDTARAEGVDITADIYPYVYWQSHMMVLLPERDPTDLSAIAFVLEQLAPPEGIIFTHFPASPQYVGKTLVQVAALRGESTDQAFSALAQLSLAWTEQTGEPGDMMIGTSMEEADLQDLMRWPHANICTDGGLLDRHPRGAGSFPRILGRYVRDLNTFPLEVAVHKMSGLPARHLGFTDRGLIAPGKKADLVLFDPDKIADRATTAEPFLSATGISHVWVNGIAVLEDGTPTLAYPGRVLRRAPQRP